jgi:hypothetical protein
MVDAEVQSGTHYACLKGERCDCAFPGPDCDFSYPREEPRNWLARLLHAMWAR